MKNICVFASSSNDVEDCFFVDATKLGQLIGSNHMNIVYGGSRLGLMYACAAAVANCGGKIIGVMPKKLHSLGVANPEDCFEFHLTEGMRERKAKMDELSDAVIALPGGYGTLEELSEMIVQKQLGYNKKPIVILNTNNFYTPLIEFFNQVIKCNFAKSASEKLYYVANTPNEAIEYLKSYNVSDVSFSAKY